MMKINKRFWSVLLSVAAVLLLLPAHSRAAGKIDPQQDVTLTLSCQSGDTALKGASFDIYLVAAVDEYGALTAEQAFEAFPVDIHGENDEAWKTLASTLEGYVLRDGIAPTDSGKTDGQGLLTFPTGESRLKQGLYLVLGQRHAQDGFYYDPAPFMVMLPALNQEENVWNYHVTADPKYDSEFIPVVPSEITRKVLKVWKDGGYENLRPDGIVVQLLCDDQVFDTVVLSAANHWRYTWASLSGDHQWTVVEGELKGYTVQVSQEGITFVVTNSFRGETPQQPGEPESPEGPGELPPGSGETTEFPDEPVPGAQLPQTGQLWWPVPMLIAAGLALIVAGLLRRKGAQHEK